MISLQRSLIFHKFRRVKLSKRKSALERGYYWASKKSKIPYIGIFGQVFTRKSKTKKFKLKFSKPTTPYAYWYKIFGYKNLDELYSIIGHGKYRTNDSNN